MRLSKISILNYKNLRGVECDFSNRLNCFVGNNGSGKTNLIDAIYYLSVCRSARASSDTACITNGEDFFMLSGEFEVKERNEKILCSYKRGAGKVVKRGQKEYERLSDHFGLLPLVMVAPQDSMLVSDSPDLRRRFINTILSQTDHTYLQTLIKYTHLLGERNQILKNFTSAGNEMLEVYDMQIESLSNYIFEARKNLIEEIAPIVREIYQKLSGDEADVAIEYRSDLVEKSYSTLAKESLEKDVILGHTSWGIHRDEMVLTINNNLVRKYGSQGEQKSFVVALKLAEYKLYRQRSETSPLLLLDDLFDRLDSGRVFRFLDMLSSEDFGQIFITECNRSRIETILSSLNEPFTIFEVEKGVVCEG